MNNKKYSRLRFKDENGNDYPEWQLKKFSDIFSFYSTNSFSRSQLNYTKGNIKNIHYGDIHTKFKTYFNVSDYNLPYINPNLNPEKISKDNFIKPGDLVLADASEDYKDVGKAIEVIAINNEKVVAGLHTLLARDKEEMALGFKGYLMQCEEVRLQIMKMATGISVLGISKFNLSKVKVRIPSIEEQIKIADFLSAIDEKIEKLEVELEQLKLYKKGVMQAIFAVEAEAASSEQRAASSEQRAASSD
jgi:type I restriction enzyme S subunit